MKTYIQAQAAFHQFDSSHFYDQYDGKMHCPVTLEDRKKMLLFFYHLLEQKNSSYEGLRELAEMKANELENLSVQMETLSWDDFRALYTSSDQSLPFIGYGSLLNRRDVKRTLPRDREFTSVIVFGTKREFKYKIDFKEGEPCPNPDEIAAVGLDLDYNPHHYFNGVVFDLARDEVDLIAKREEHYRLMKLPYIEISSKTPEIKEAYALIYPQNDGIELRPYLNYLFLIVSGMKNEIGLTQFFCETTFLADGTTSVAEWIRNEATQYFLLQE